ncbi:TrmH family RNA methyltransferase [Hyunsoonleella sp. 2307UL5-6]|uniref:TrmH family RNA methyltransferase n=1 Tax=Hyunsoonleella sp. 2307UL5-6 TaxID=3384768 RepID=UPI0039BD373D
MQLTHYNTSFKKQTFPIVLVCDNVTNAPNIGSLFRICDAFGVEQLILCGENIPLGRKMKKTSRATEKIVHYKTESSALAAVTQLKKDNFEIIALEITSKSKSISHHKFLNNKPIALIIGDENFGVTQSILQIADAIIHIEMFGQNSSMNVVQATNIALYEITKQLL